MDQEYDRYLRAEWELFAKDVTRSAASLGVVRGPVSRVLDAGCGAGQELLPFIRLGAFGFGVDIDPHVGSVGRELFAREGFGDRVAFLRSASESLPFQSGSFDIVVSRLAIPYTDNAKALAEMFRVLSPSGLLLLKIHHAGFYINKIWNGLRSGKILDAVHGMRVLTAGAIYHLTGKQVRNRIVTGETFQTQWMLTRELNRHSFYIERLMPDSNWMTPSYLISRRPS
jgi:SAM-dependent methyltransferase